MQVFFKAAYRYALHFHFKQLSAILDPMINPLITFALALGSVLLIAFFFSVAIMICIAAILFLPLILFSGIILSIIRYVFFLPILIIGVGAYIIHKLFSGY